MLSDVVNRLAHGEIITIDPVGTDYSDAVKQARDIWAYHQAHGIQQALVALITKIQQDAKTIEMLEYNQKWRKRRP